MNYTAVLVGMVLILFFIMLVFLEIGRWIGRRRVAGDSEGGRVGLGAVEGAVFGLMGLLLAFTFSGAATRFEARRQLIVAEANAIETAYLRTDLLPPGPRAVLQDTFRRYLDARLEMPRKLPDIAAAKAALARSLAIQHELWEQAVAACSDDKGQEARGLLLPALNAMTEHTNTRTEATRMHPPVVIYLMLVALALACSMLAGYAMSGRSARNWGHLVGFAAIIAVTIYVIVDMEFPRVGLIRLDAADQVLADLRAGMK